MSGTWLELKLVLKLDGQQQHLLDERELELEFDGQQQRLFDAPAEKVLCIEIRAVTSSTRIGDRKLTTSAISEE